MLYVLDSTVLIDYLRGRPAVQRVRALHSRGDTLATTAVNVEEIVRGVRSGETSAVANLFAGLLVLPLDRAGAWQAGEWRRDHASKGVTLSQSDCLIASATVLSQGVLATGNPRDFPMPGLELEHWPVGR